MSTYCDIVIALGMQDCNIKTNAVLMFQELLIYTIFYYFSLAHAWFKENKGFIIKHLIALLIISLLM